jgi:hypothetical protein
MAGCGLRIGDWKLGMVVVEPLRGITLRLFFARARRLADLAVRFGFFEGLLFLVLLALVDFPPNLVKTLHIFPVFFGTIT